MCFEAKISSSVFHSSQIVSERDTTMLTNKKTRKRNSPKMWIDNVPETDYMLVKFLNC